MSPLPESKKAERPILFSGPMVRAILREVDPKTQTRRVVKPQPPDGTTKLAHIALMPPKPTGEFEELRWIPSFALAKPCPYGVPGDRLWVRETWAYGCCEEAEKTSDRMAVYRADLDEDDLDEDAALRRMYPKLCETFKFNRWRPSIFMPRWASRITLEVTEVRVQRLQEISEEDAIAEGADMLDSGLECSECKWTGFEDSKGVKRIDDDDDDWEFICPQCGEVCAHHPMDEQHRWGFRRLWDSINLKRGFGWDANPWVWCVTFRRSGLPQ